MLRPRDRGEAGAVTRRQWDWMLVALAARLGVTLRALGEMDVSEVNRRLHHV